MKIPTSPSPNTSSTYTKRKKPLLRYLGIRVPCFFLHPYPDFFPTQTIAYIQHTANATIHPIHPHNKASGKIPILYGLIQFIFIMNSSISSRLTRQVNWWTTTPSCEKTMWAHKDKLHTGWQCANWNRWSVFLKPWRVFTAMMRYGSIEGLGF